MNSKVAVYYNKLLNESKEVYAVARSDGYVSIQHSHCKDYKELVESARNIIREVWTQVLDARIHEAATAMKQCRHTCCVGGESFLLTDSHDLDLWEAAKPQIQAVLDTYNAGTRARFEAYRQQCVQGTAVPPMCEEKE